MSILQNKIDFAAIILVKNANPNGDPLNGNRPRTTYSGIGEISDVCIKRKIRNRLQDMGENIFVKTEERSDDGFLTLKDRANGNNEIALLLKEKKVNKEQVKTNACKSWFDVRAFGQVFAIGHEKKDEEGSGVSVGVRGPVTFHQAKSCSIILPKSIQIVKSVDSDNKEGKKARMGYKHYVDFGLYEIKGSINVQLAEKTGFSDEDAEKIKECLRTLFINDSSSARPDGSMEVIKVYWWKHNCKIGQYSSAKVHRTLDIKLKSGVVDAKCIDDYEIILNNLDGLAPEIIDGI